MSDDEPPPPRGPAPTFLWLMLGLLLVIAFLILLRIFVHQPAL